MTAIDIFNSDKFIYKSDDYHCLKPNSHKDPTKWHKYDAPGYRKAFNKEMLENVKTFKYDKNLYNFADPEVFKTFTMDEKKAKKNWKKTYRFQYTSKIPAYDSERSFDSSNITRCIKKCINMENSKFAKKCTKSGGYFKCCTSYWTLNPFEEARNQLIKDGLIKDSETNICGTESSEDGCTYCSTNGICTKENPSDGTLTHHYYPKMKKNSEGEQKSYNPLTLLGMGGPFQLPLNENN